MYVCMYVCMYIYIYMKADMLMNLTFWEPSSMKLSIISSRISPVQFNEFVFCAQTILVSLSLSPSFSEFLSLSRILTQCQANVPVKAPSLSLALSLSLSL